MKEVINIMDAVKLSSLNDGDKFKFVIIQGGNYVTGKRVFEKVSKEGIYINYKELDTNKNVKKCLWKTDVIFLPPN